MAVAPGVRPLLFRASSRPAACLHRRARAQASSLDAPDLATAERDAQLPIALESVDVVPLPTALVTDDEGVEAEPVDLAALPPVADAGEEPVSGAFQLNKAQSFWLLNIVAALGYGPNTVRHPWVRHMRSKATPRLCSRRSVDFLNTMIGSMPPAPSSSGTSSVGETATRSVQAHQGKAAVRPFSSCSHRTCGESFRL